MLSGKLKKTACKGMAGLLTAAMCATLIPCVTGGSKVLADETKNQDNTYLGIAPITNPDKPENPDSEWSGSYVLFGTYGVYPIRFRVLAKNSTVQTANKSLFLDSDTCLFKRQFNEKEDSGVWEGSSLQEYLNGDFYDTSFTGREQNAIATSVYAGGDPYAEDSYEDQFYHSTTGLNDKIFLLDCADILNESYGYYPWSGWSKNSANWSDGYYTYVHVPNHIKKSSFYWLRSEYKRTANSTGFVGEVYDGGAVSFSSVFFEQGVAPALCVDQESILFTSRVPYDYDDTDNEFRLTLIDEDMEIGIPEDKYVMFDDDYAVTVPYEITGDNADSANRVSVLILDGEYSAGNTNNADIIYYDVLDGAFGTSGTGKFELPEQLDIDDWGKSYHVYIVAEDTNEDMETEYASEPVEIDAPLNGWILIGDDYFYFEVEIREFISGWFKDGGNWYYLIPPKGNMAKGWLKIEGTWYYFNKSGAMATDWKKIDGNWYYFGSNGKMRTNWAKIDGDWYYFGSNGKMRTGWQKISSNWYYFRSDGVMVTGWEKVGDYWYYFTPDGVMAYGWVKIEGKYYYFNEDGVMVTGWQLIDGDWYYFNDSGEMAAEEYCGGYWLDPDGRWTYEPIASWKTDAKGKYYQDTTGWYAKGKTYIIDGVKCTFDAEGYLKET